ncbi:MAG: hypothetical protein R3E83_18615 [Burkholderiaceae bacterium]
MRFDWSAARPAFSDRQMDSDGCSNPVAPSPMVEEYAASEPLRFLEFLTTRSMIRPFRSKPAIPGNSLEKLDPTVYGKGAGWVIKEPVNTIASWLGAGHQQGRA